MAWQAPTPYEPKKGLDGILSAPKPGTLEFKCAQISYRDDLANFMSVQEAQQAIIEGLVPADHYEKVRRYAMGADALEVVHSSERRAGANGEWTPPEDYQPKPGLAVILTAPAVGTLEFKAAQFRRDDLEDFISVEEAREAIDKGLVPPEHYDKVLAYALG